MTEVFIGAGIVLFLFAIYAAWADHRRGKRADIDKVGWINWPLVLMLSLVGAMMMAILAVKS